MFVFLPDGIRLKLQPRGYMGANYRRVCDQGYDGWNQGKTGKGVGEQ